jgi:hypothetical protein
MAKLIDTAEALMDMYYQQYRTDEDFFTLDHFVYICAVVYSKILEDEYQQARREARQQEGYANIVLNHDFLISEKITPQKEDGDYVLNLKSKLFAFPYDPYSFAIQRIHNPAAGCKRFIRTNMLKADWMEGILPKTDRVFYYGFGSKIILKNVSCLLKGPITVYYVPEISAADPQVAEIPEGKGYQVLAGGFDLMSRARNGEPVDMTNNSNPNKAMQTELDTTFSNIRTKPI